MQMVRQGPVALLRLNKELTRDIKRGHAWLYSDAIELVENKAATSKGAATKGAANRRHRSKRQTPDAGTVAILLDRKSENRIASGIHDPEHAIPLRICRTEPPLKLDDVWLADALMRAAKLRQDYFGSDTTGVRLVAGEGDGVPGLVIDVYDKTAVMKLDGGAPEAFYQPQGIATWLAEHLPIDRVVLRSRERGRAGQVLLGEPIDEPIPFLENGLKFYADVVHGQKTGFFLDQRDNRELIRKLARGKSLLNLFSFNGGFSVAAGVGGAQRVTSVDIARGAIDAADALWEANGLSPEQHEGVVADCFEFLESAVAKTQKNRWDIVICDPPSFAPSERSIPQAATAYEKLARLAAKITERGGLLALASCSSHIDRRTFFEINNEALGKARRKATLIADRGLPIDHPTPAAMPELRYLKFLLFRLD